MTALVRNVEGIVGARDVERWRRLWLRLGATRPIQFMLDALRPDFLEYESGISGLDEHTMPAPDSPELKQLLRFIARSQVVHAVDLVETKWHVWVPELPGAFPDLHLADSEEYHALGELVFTVGAMPEGLEALDEYPNVTTNWIDVESITHLCALERKEGVLASVGRSPDRTALASDFLALKGLLEMAEQTKWSIYLWEPGT